MVQSGGLCSRFQGQEMKHIVCWLKQTRSKHTRDALNEMKSFHSFAYISNLKLYERLLRKLPVSAGEKIVIPNYSRRASVYKKRERNRTDDFSGWWGPILHELIKRQNKS